MQRERRKEEIIVSREAEVWLEMSCYFSLRGRGLVGQCLATVSDKTTCLSSAAACSVCP